MSTGRYVWKELDYSCGDIKRHFQHSVERAAERVFKALDPNLEVDVFLLGLVREDLPAKPETHPVCLEPEECGFQPEAFASVRKDTNHFMAISPDRNVMAMAESASAVYRGAQIG